MASNFVMRIKQLVKAALVVGAILSSISAFGAPIQSTLGTGTGSSSFSPPKDPANSNATDAPYGEAFILEKGYANVNQRTTNSSQIDGTTPGRYYDRSCGNSTTFIQGLLLAVNYYGSTNLPICRGVVATSKRCPRSFSPVVTLTPVSVAITSYTPIFACQTPSHTSLGTYSTGVDIAATNGYPNAQGYVFEFVTPAASSSNGSTFEPFVSAKWEMWCYPTVKRDNTFTASNVKPPPPEGCAIAKSATLDTQILLWDRGNIDFVGTPTFNTHRRCPLGWTPSVEFGARSTPGTRANTFNGQHEAMGPQVACINSITNASGNRYKVDFLIKSSLVRMDYAAKSITIEDPASAAIANLHWSLYCYPPNISPNTVAATAGDLNCTPAGMNTP